MTLSFRTSTQFHVIYGIEYLLKNEQDKHRSSKLDDEVEHTIKDSSHSLKDIRIKREFTHQRNKDKCLILISYISTYLNDIIQVCSYIQEMYYACLSVWIYEWYTTKFHVMGT